MNTSRRNRVTLRAHGAMGAPNRAVHGSMHRGERFSPAIDGVGRDRDRAAHVMGLLTVQTVAGVVCTRGGYGAIGMLPYFNQDCFRQGRLKHLLAESGARISLGALIREIGIPARWANTSGPRESQLSIPLGIELRGRGRRGDLYD